MCEDTGGPGTTCCRTGLRSPHTTPVGSGKLEPRLWLTRQTSRGTLEFKPGELLFFHSSGLRLGARRLKRHPDHAYEEVAQVPQHSLWSILKTRISVWPQEDIAGSRCPQTGHLSEPSTSLLPVLGIGGPCRCAPKRQAAWRIEPRPPPFRPRQRRPELGNLLLSPAVGWVDQIRVGLYSGLVTGLKPSGERCHAPGSFKAPRSGGPLKRPGQPGPARLSVPSYRFGEVAARYKGAAGQAGRRLRTKGAAEC